MASTYSNLKIQLMATGENSGTWGNVTNVNLGTAIEQAIAQTADIDFTSGDVTLTLADTNAAQDARAMRLNCTNVGAARNLVVPAIEKPYIVNNSASSYDVTIKVSGQTGVVVPAGKTMLVYNNGTDVVDAITHLSSTTLSTPLAVTSGGTGSNTATFSGANITSLNASSVSSGVLSASYGGTGITALGTGVATALGVNTGSAGAFVTFDGALGTPSSGTLSSCTVDGTDAVGFRNTPVNGQATDYTLVLADAGKTIYHSAADTNDRTYTIPANASVAYPVGTAITFVNMSANSVSIAITSDTMYLANDGATGTRTLVQYGVATALKFASTTWIISGNGVE